MSQTRPRTLFESEPFSDSSDSLAFAGWPRIRSKAFAGEDADSASTSSSNLLLDRRLDDHSSKPATTSSASKTKSSPSNSKSGSKTTSDQSNSSSSYRDSSGSTTKRSKSNQSLSSKDSASPTSDASGKSAGSSKKTKTPDSNSGDLSNTKATGTKSKKKDIKEPVEPYAEKTSWGSKRSVPKVPDKPEKITTESKDPDIPAPKGPPKKKSFPEPSVPPQEAEESGAIPSAESITSDTPQEKIPPLPLDFLKPPEDGNINEQPESYEAQGFFEKVGDWFSNFLDSLFDTGKEDEPVGSDDNSQVGEPISRPVAFPPPRNPAVTSPDYGGSAPTYVSQKDIEQATGRESWTMCCATTFVYAIQSKYPALGTESILQAVESAANTELEGGDGKCVSDDGTVNSICQYSQALSKNLGLADYVDVSGMFDSVKDAQEAGASMMKVELSGTIGDLEYEHHTFVNKGETIDPYSKEGIDQHWDQDSESVENVMALDWYQLP